MLSGKQATDLFNGIINWLLLCICFLVLCSACFRLYVAMLCLGDDHVGGVAKRFRSKFNAASIHEFVAQFGFIYTSANKTMDFDDFYVRQE